MRCREGLDGAPVKTDSFGTVTSRGDDPPYPTVAAWRGPMEKGHRIGPAAGSRRPEGRQHGALAELDGIGVWLGGRQILAMCGSRSARASSPGSSARTAGQDHPDEGHPRPARADGRGGPHRGRPLHNKDKSASATCRRSSSSTPTCRCAPATWSPWPRWEPARLRVPGPPAPRARGPGAGGCRRGRVPRRAGRRAFRPRAAAGPVAHALISRPGLLLLDAPLANLDLRSEQEIVALLGKLAREHEIAVLLSAHDMNPLLAGHGPDHLRRGRARWRPAPPARS